MASLTFLDLAYREKSDALTGLIEDVTTYAPELASFPVTVRKGITYKVLQRVTLPTSAFRLPNTGLTGSVSTYKSQIKEMFPVDCQIVVDEIIYKGDDGITGDLLAQEAAGALQSTFINIGAQTYYGNPPTDNSNGFVGLRQQTANTSSVGTAATGSTSAYLLWLTPQGVGYDVGKEGSISLPPFQRQLVDSAIGSRYVAWWTNLNFFIGLSVKSNQSVFAVTGIIPGSATQNLTDVVASKLLAKVPLNRRNGLQWFMNRDGHQSLHASRTSIGYQPADATGRVAWAPFPEECMGIPIVVTDSITSNEQN